MLQVGRLAKRLPQGDLAAMAAQLGVAGGPKGTIISKDDLNEDDLT